MPRAPLSLGLRSRSIDILLLLYDEKRRGVDGLRTVDIIHRLGLSNAYREYFAELSEKGLVRRVKRGREKYLVLTEDGEIVARYLAKARAIITV